MLKIKALNNKQRSLQQELIRKVEEIKRLKLFSKKIGNVMNKNGDNDDEHDIDNILNHKMGHVRDDIWSIGSMGEISEKGGCSFYVSLRNKRDGFRGNLHNGDKILLLSKRAYFNRINDNILSGKFMIIRSKSGHFNHEIGYIKLTSTSYYTKRSVYQF